MKMRFFGVHEAVVGFRNVLTLIVRAILVVFFVQGRADDPSYIVLVFLEDLSFYLAERWVTRPDIWVLDGWSVFMAIVRVSDGIVVDRMCPPRCVHLG